MAQRLFRSDDDSKLTSKYGNGSQGSKTFSSNETLDSGDYYYNGTLTGTAGAVTGTTNLADGTYNLPCKIIQTRGTGSNASVNYEYNKLLSVASGVAQFAFPLTKNWVSGAQMVTSGNWVNVTINNGVTVTIPAFSTSTGLGGVFYMTGKGEFLQVGTGNVDLRGKGFTQGLAHNDSSDRDYGGYGGWGAAGRSGKGGFSGGDNNGDTGNGTVAGDFPSGGSRDRDGAESSHGAAGGENYTGGGGGGGANSHGLDESSGGGGGGGNYYGGGGGGNGTDSAGSGGAGGAASGLGGGDGGGWPSSGVNLAGDASGASGTANNYSGHGGDGQPGAGRNGGGGGGGADANPQAELKAMHMGGGGGGGGHYNNNNGTTDRGANGGLGGGLSSIAFPRITLTGGVLTTGSDAQGAQSSRGGGGGGGAAGDQRYIGQYIDLGSNCNAAGGNPSNPTNGGEGGYGSRGSIHADYLVEVTGTTSPTVTTRQDKSLRILRAGVGVLAGLLST